MADSSSYPTSLDGELDDLVPPGTTPVGFSDYLKLLGDAVARIEEELGLEPSGGWDDVVSRLNGTVTKDWPETITGQKTFHPPLDQTAVTIKLFSWDQLQENNIFEIIDPDDGPMVWVDGYGNLHGYFQPSGTMLFAAGFTDSTTTVAPGGIAMGEGSGVTAYPGAAADAAHILYGVNIGTIWPFFVNGLGQVVFGQTAAPTDFAPVAGDDDASKFSFWLDPDNATPMLMVTATTADGTVVEQAIPLTGDVGGGGSAVLARAVLSAGGVTGITATDSVANVNGTLSVTFTVPASGEVFVDLDALNSVGSGTSGTWGLADGGTQFIAAQTGYDHVQAHSHVRLFVDGLTPGESVTWTWTHQRTFGSGDVTFLYGGEAGDAIMSVSGAAVTAPTSGSGGGGGVLGYTTLNPGILAAPLATTTLSDVDADLNVTFTAPASGNVIIQLSGYGRPASNGPMLMWGLRDNSDVEVVAPLAIQVEATSPGLRHEMTVVVEDLTPNTEYTWKWTHQTDTGSANTFFGGVVGQANMIVTDATIQTSAALSYVDTVLADEPVAFWQLQEASGTDMLDSSGNAIDGTYVNSPTPTVSGPGIYRAMVFDDAGDTNAVTPMTALLRPTHVTVEAWVKTTQTTWGCVASCSAAPYGYNMFITDATGTVRGGGDDGIGFHYSDTAVNDGAWHHVAISYDQTAFKVFVDGVEETSDAETDVISYRSDGDFKIGAQTDSSSFNFTGSMAMVAIYDRALTEAELAEHVAAMGA